MGRSRKTDVSCESETMNGGDGFTVARRVSTRSNGFLCVSRCERRMRYGKRKRMRYRFDMWTQTDYIVVQPVEERCTIFRNAKRDSMILSRGNAWINTPEYIPCQAELPVFSTSSRCGRLRRHNGAPVHEHSIDRGSASRQERICSGY